MKPIRLFPCLSAIFNRKGLMLAATLAFGVGASAYATDNSPPVPLRLSADDKSSPSADMLYEQKQTLQVLQKPDTPALKALRSEFGRTPLGRALLDFADAEKILIVFDMSITANNNFAQYTPENSTITVRPDLQLEEQVLYLAHELRHSWQDRALGYSALNAKRLTPVQRFTLHRHVEADAHSFSAYFWADRMQRLGTVPEAEYAVFELSLARKLREKMDNTGKIMPQDYGDIALLPYFAHLEDYNNRHIATASRATDLFRAEVRAAAESGLTERFNALAADIAAAPDTEAFAGWLRRLGGVDLSVGGETALTNIPLAALLEDYPMGGLSTHELMPRLGSAGAVMPPPRDRLARLQEIDAKQRVTIHNNSR